MLYKESNYNLYIEKNDKHYIYNSLSGELIKVDNETYSYLKNLSNDKSPEDNGYFTYLREKGFIVNESMNEYLRINAQKKELMYSSQSAHVSYVIALTLSCNYKCIYCYENGNNSIENMTHFDASKTVEFIINRLSKNKLVEDLNITWFGGEPLLNMDELVYIGDSVQEYCEKHGIVLSTNIITNGYYLEEKRYHLLSKYNLRNIQITIDGKEGEYNRLKCPSKKAYEKVVNNIVYLSQLTHITIRLNCLKSNYNSIKEFCVDLPNMGVKVENIDLALSRIDSPDIEDIISVEEFSDYKIDFISFLCDIGFTRQMKAYLPKPKVIPCGLMKNNNFVIDPKGYLYKCEHYVGQEKFSVGNVKSGLLYPEIQERFENTPFFDKCSVCEIFPICRGGCSQKRFVGQSSVACERKKQEIAYILNAIVG